MSEHYIANNEVSSRWSRLFYALNTGPLAEKSKLIAEQLEQGIDLPFERIIASNLGNPHKFQKPNSYIRDVLSLVMSPELLEDEVIASTFKPDVIRRAKEIRSWVPANLSGDVYPAGVPEFREAIAKFITERDEGCPACASDDVLLSNGATLHIITVIRMLCNGLEDGIMIPVPEYPAYGSAAGIAGATVINYYLEEENGWSIEFNELERAYKEAVAKGITPRVLVMINPGNPTGTIFSREDIERACRFAQENNLTIIADEVYQKNLWTNPKGWVSFRRVAHETGLAAKGLKLASFHSISKGFIGECGLRGGYVELTNFDKEVIDGMCRIAALNSINIIGQVVTYLMVDRPVESDESYEDFNGQIDAARASMKHRAELFIEFLKTLKGVEVAPPGGAMYVFPKLHLPAGFLKYAEEEGAEPDDLYCAMLLEHTGLRVVPGSAFGQREGVYHLRATILPAVTDFQNVFPLWEKMHNDLYKKYE